VTTFSSFVANVPVWVRGEEGFGRRCGKGDGLEMVDCFMEEGLTGIEWWIDFELGDWCRGLGFAIVHRHNTPPSTRPILNISYMPPMSIGTSLINGLQFFPFHVLHSP